MINTTFFLIIFALVGDMYISNNAFVLHPVVCIGEYANMIYHILYKRASRVAGIFAWICVVIPSIAIVYVLSSLPYIGFIIQCYFAYIALSLGMLRREGKKALGYITKNDLKKARIAVGFLVSRDTSRMEVPLLYQSLAESLSENFIDAFLAPLFWLCIGGVPLLWGYKAVSTLDSMWGYTTKEFNNFGWFSAKVDDVMAYIPARLAYCILLLTAYCIPHRGEIPSYRVVAQEAKSMKSPNGGWTMSLMAHVHSGSMGGDIPYSEGIVQKPLLGKENMLWNADTIEMLIHHLYVTHYCIIVFFALCYLIQNIL